MEQQEKQREKSKSQEQFKKKDGEEGYRPCIEENSSREQRIFNNSLPGADLMTIDQCETMREMDDSQLVGPPPSTLRDVNMVDVQVVTAAKVGDMMTTVKRKRGRPPRIQGKTALPQPQPQPQRKKTDEEDVCFICFDGGSLVLCDRRGCPKAYHPACIKRDDAFFRSKAKWNCGWHICSSCQKASHYMCYTCTYSLCKGCTKDADYVNVRGNKGFCGTCLKTIMLIENVKLGNSEMVQVDFDDQTSWEYLFKIYWVYLKHKLSLTVDELTKARNPWKGDEVPKAKNSWRGAVMVAPKEVSSGELHHGNDGKGSSLGICSGNVEPNNSKRRKTMDLPEGTVWATKELLELVAHMKNGDTSVLSQFDVQALLLEYIKKNNLRDPRQKSQIICDARLANMFGKPRVGHFEMLKLLEYHYLIKEKSPADDTVSVGVPDAVVSQVEAARGSHGQSMVGNDKRRKSRKKMDDGVSLVNPNPDEYAAIDVHNINLLYLKRDLMEILMDDSEKFQEKVVGSFVRIRISGGDQKQDMHRLVQVVGTSKVAESYKVGSKTTDFMLEILNLNKKEVVSIDAISNQEFSEEECIRLRQSIKCGLIKQLKVGEIQEKAMVLQPVKVGDWLEAEVLRLNHLRDRASEKGHRKELRECVEKLELLKSPKECQRRLLEIPNVHADPNMDPGHDSEEDAGESNENQQGGHARARDTGIGGKGIELNSPVRESDLNDVGNSGLNNLVKACEQSRNACTTFYVDRDGTTRVHEGVSESTWRQEDGALGLNVDNTSKNQFSSDSVNGQAAVKSDKLTGVVSSVTPHQPSEGEQSVSDLDEEKLWHYQDPSGKIQGPFSVVQLRKWSTIGLFPLDFRVWRMDEKQEDSVLLTDALSGRFSKHPVQPSNSHLEPQEAKFTSNDEGQNIKCELSQSTVASWLDSKRVDNDSKPVQNDVNIQGVGDSELVNSNTGLGSHSSSLSKPVDVKMDNDAQDQSSLRGWELAKDSKFWIGQSQIHGSLSSAASSPGKPFENPSPQVREGHGDEKWSSNVNSHRNIDEKRERSDSDGHSNQSSGQNWGGQPIKSSPSRWDSNSGFLSAAKTIEKPEPHQEIDFSDLLSPRPKQSHENLKDDTAKSKLPLASNVPVQDSRPTWSTASNLVVGGGQFPDIAGEWGGYSSHTKPSVEEWDSNHVSASSLKTTEGAIDHAATPTSGTGALTVSSSTHPTIDTSGWQPIVPEPNEFCSLVDESVSDLLAEVEAMESLGGLPSPTSKLNCGGELTPGSDNDCFSPVETFSPAPDPGKSDALSSTGDIRLSTQLPAADVVLRLSHTPSQPTITNEPLAVSQMPSQLAMTDKHNPLSQMPRSIVQDEPLGTSPMPCQSTLTEEPLGLWHTNILDAQKSFSRHSPRSGHKKLSEISVNQWEARSEPQASSGVNKGEAGSHFRARTSSSVGQWETGSELQLPVSTAADTSYGTMKGNVNLNRGVSQGNTNMAWGTGHGAVQQQASSTSAGILGSWGSQSRHGGDNRLSSSRDSRNYHHQGRDSGFGSRERSSWNRQPSYGAGSGGGSYKSQGKGQRVCKFYENGHCKKGASCSYWHP